jgi:adenylosuccinate synthase
MPVKVVIGAQWGDEGKGKLIDFLSEEAKVVARYQGGANAGHTVYIGNKKYILHLVPGGILRPNVTCIIGNGVVVDPVSFFAEIDFLAKNGISVKDRLFISDRAHIIFPYHKMIDQAQESALKLNKIGTTGRGIGPSYVDKYSRCGIRIIDLFDQQYLKARLQEVIEYKNKILVEIYNQKPLSFNQIFKRINNDIKLLVPFVSDTGLQLYNAYLKGDPILLEGAQGCLLDIDFGSYPFVTSSSPTIGGCITGTGLPVKAIDQIIGVMKAYQTRVGSGPFPSEDKSELGEKLRDIGQEYGATTGRPRRCGWLDAVAAKYSIRINGFTSIALTKMDVLDNFDQIKLCTGYKYKNKKIEDFPASVQVLNECEPIFEQFDGWKEQTSEYTRFEQLPRNAQYYIHSIEKIFDVPIQFVCVGKERKQIIVRK